jgi:A/G-specific adenine glycosylase
VLRLWQGLGYYRRARDLHRAARLLVERHGGAIPNDADALAALPGFGRYTRNAVLSQAFDRRLPIVEANSARVLARLFACDVDLKSKEAQRWLWGTAEALLPRRRAGAFNQALMELGALVCRSGEPLCLLCPLAKHCIARADGLQQALPIIAKRAAAVEVKEIAIALHRGGKVLLVQRPAEGRWANLWEFPHGPLLEDETPLIAVTRLAWELTGLHASAGAELGTIRHGIMHFRVEMRCYESRPAKGRFCSRFYQRGKWLRLDELADYPISSPQRRLAAMLGERKSG